MARARTAYLNRADVPDRAALQAALDAFKLKLVLDDGYVPLETSGYLPCTLHGEDAGFTLRFREVGEDGESTQPSPRPWANGTWPQTSSGPATSARK